MTKLALKTGRGASKTKTFLEVTSVALGQTGKRVVLKTAEGTSVWLPVDLIPEIVSVSLVGPVGDDA